MLTVEQLIYRYDRWSAPVLNGVDLTLHDGEIGILLGRNGSGKTTLFKNILGICTPDSGVIRFDGQDLAARSRRERARCIAYVPQDIRFGALTVFDSVLLGGRRSPLPVRWRRSRGCWCWTSPPAVWMRSTSSS